MRARSAGISDPVVKRLREIGRESPALKEAAIMYEAVLPLLRDSKLHIEPVRLTPVEARRKMEEGLPLLHGLDIEIDLQDAQELMLLLSRTIEKCINKPHVRGVRFALEKGRFDVGTLLSHISKGDTDAVRELAAEIGLDPDVLKTIARFCLSAAIQMVRKQLIPLIDGLAWNKGICYVCGASASFAELRGNNQTKHLRCGQCGADWPARRLQCAWCGNEDHRALGYLSPEKKEETMRIEVCEKCRGYLKVVVSFSPLPPEMLFVEDLATVQLDYIAQGRGYVSPAQRPYNPAH